MSDVFPRATTHTARARVVDRWPVAACAETTLGEVEARRRQLAAQHGTWCDARLIGGASGAEPAVVFVVPNHVARARMADAPAAPAPDAHALAVDVGAC